MHRRRFGIFFALLILISSVARAELSQFRFHLHWNPVAGVAKYKVQIAKEKDFSSILSEQVVDSPEWEWIYRPETPEPERRELYYRVASIGEDGEVGGFSHAKPVSLPEPEIIPKVYGFRFSGSLEAGLGSQSQSSSDAALHSVMVTTPYLQEKVSTRFDLLRGDGEAIAFFTLAADGELFMFHKITDPRPFDQPSLTTYVVRGDAIFWPLHPGGFDLGFGAVAERDFRWVKLGSESVDTSGGFSFGPAFWMDRVILSDRWYVPARVEARLDLPVAGIFMGGGAGGAVSALTEWKIPRVSWLRASLGAEFSYERFTTPASTSLLGWSLWISPTIRIEPATPKVKQN
ncbi:MAG: hypothetical protein ACXWPM_00295 [Bdellovibrionota bacterium]